MPTIDRQLREAWDALRAEGAQRRDFLRAIRIRHLRGIQDLRVTFPYPVCVLAGPNGSGKSTVLFACACGYQDPDRNPRDLAPGSLFPNFAHGRQGELSDAVETTELEFDYVQDGESYSMSWKRGKSWNRTFMGRRGGRQPTRALYLRTLANLTNPSEVRGLLQLARKPFRTEEVTPELLIFAHRILPRRYSNLSVIRAKARDLLFAEVEGDEAASYSEFHMSSGERAVLRISKDISRLRGALVLIDEVEAGLHPYTQQQAMLELQRIALRQQLQIVVASHSPVVLDSVPPEARIFLDRGPESDVRVMPPYRDIFQKALYGQSRDQLSILCEDAVAEAMVRGVLDVLNAEMGLRHDDFVVGRNTGRDEFPGHIRTLGKFGRLRDFLVVLDGDSRDLEKTIEGAAEEYGQRIRPLFLPDHRSPEFWIWKTLGGQTGRYGDELGLSATDLARRMREIEQLFAGSVRPRDKAKAALGTFAEELDRTAEDLARIAGRREAEAKRGEMARFRVELQEQINAWRQEG